MNLWIHWGQHYLTMTEVRDVLMPNVLREPGSVLVNDFRPPTPLFKIAQNSIALNTISYDVAS